MSYGFITGIIGDYPVPTVLTFYFLFLTLFGDIRVKISSFVIFTSSLFIMITASYDFSVIGNLVSEDAFIADVGISILWDGITALILVMFIRYDDYVVRQASLLAFATTCQIMVLLYLTTTDPITKSITVLFYTWYDELIILVGLLQLLVAKNGMVDAIRRVEVYIRRNSNSIDGYS